MTKEHEDVALKFISYFRDTWPADFDEPLKLLSEDCYYASIVPTTEPIRGKAAIKAKWRQIRETFGDQRHDMKSIGSGDRVVFTERVDWTHFQGVWASIPLVAVFELNEDNLICGWREYLDAGNVSRQIGMSVDAIEQSLSE